MMNKYIDDGLVIVSFLYRDCVCKYVISIFYLFHLTIYLIYICE